MRIPILIEPVEGQGFRVSTGSPLNLSAEAATRDEAITQLRLQIARRYAAGAEIEELDVGPKGIHPSAKFVGTLKDDPLLDQWREAVAEYRRQRDAEDEERDAL